MIGGLLLLAWTLCALAVIGAAIVGRWHDGKRPDEEACDAVLAAAAVAMVTVAVLGSAGVLWPRWVLATTTGLAVVSVAARGRAPLRVWSRAGLALLQALRASPVLWVLVALGATCVARALTIPQLAWDGHTYHTTYPATWVQEGRFVPLQGDGTWELYETFPKGIESLVYLTLAFGHRDDLLNLVNLPFWILTGVALRAALGTLAVGGATRDLWVVIVLACSVLLAYVTPAYVEVPTAACGAVMLAAGARVIARRDVGGLVSLGLAMGVALSIKLTMLAWALPALLVSVYALKTFGFRATRNTLAAAVALAVLIAAPWYVHNARVCGNPIYPSGLLGFSEGARAGTSLNRWALEESSVIALRAGDQVIDALIAPPWKIRYPLGPGWLFVLLFGGAFVLPFFVDDVRARTTALVLTLATVFLFAVYVYTPYNGLYADADTRFLGPCLIAAMMACALALQRLALRWRVAGLCACVVIDGITLGRTELVWYPYSATALVVAASGVIALGLAVGGVTAARLTVRRVLAASSVIATVVGAAFLPAALVAREESRQYAYGLRVDLHPKAGFPRIWAHVERLPPSRIGLAVGHPLAQEGWFFYPLFAADLRHHVRHVPIERNDVPACLVRGLTRDQPDERAWLRRMRERDYLVVVSDPIELTWVNRHPERFSLVLTDGTARMYRVRP